MKLFILNMTYFLGNIAKRMNAALTSEDLARTAYCPSPPLFGTEFLDSLGPPSDPLLPIIDFLAEANQANRHRPIVMTRHRFKNQQRFGRLSAKFFFPLACVPSSLSLIKNDDMARWWRGAAMHILF